MAIREAQWTASSIAKRASEVLRAEGPKSLAFRVLGEIAYRRAILFELDITQRKQEPGPPPGLRFEPVRPESIDRLLAISPTCDEPEARRRLSAGHICLIGYVEEMPAYCGWLALAAQPFTIDFLRVRAALAPRCAYTYEIYVTPALRKSGIATAGLEARIRLLRKRGVERFVSVVVPENRAGLGHTLAAGFQPIGRVHSFRLFGRQRSWVQCSIDSTPLALLR